MDMKKVKGVANFDSKFVTFDDGSVYIRFDYGGFYEWYERTDNTFSLSDVVDSKDLEESLGNYESSREPNVIDFDEIRLKQGITYTTID